MGRSKGTWILLDLIRTLVPRHTHTSASRSRSGQRAGPSLCTQRGLKPLCVFLDQSRRMVRVSARRATECTFPLHHNDHHQHRTRSPNHTHVITTNTTKQGRSPTEKSLNSWPLSMWSSEGSVSSALTWGPRTWPSTARMSIGRPTRMPSMISTSARIAAAASSIAG